MKLILKIKYFIFSRRADDDTKMTSPTEVATEDRGWFRRRDKSSSRELDKGTDEKATERSRWFRRRDKASPRGSIDHGIRRKESDKKKHQKTSKNENKGRQSSIDRGRDSGSESADSRDQRQRSSSDQTVTNERLRVPLPTVRRLSSPEIDACGVITASLKIPVPLQQQNSCSPAYSKDTDIPYIEDTNLAEDVRTRRRDGSVSSRQRTGSSDSYLGQPITGTMSFQPLCNKNGEKQSHDSVLSSSSADMFTLSPSPRNTPLSDIIFSETSSPMSRATSPPLVLSPDSGTPGLSPPPSPPPPLLPRRTRRLEQISARSIPLSHSATHTYGNKSSMSNIALHSRGTRERGSSRMTSIIPITRSRTAEVPSHTVLSQTTIMSTGTTSENRVCATQSAGTKTTTDVVSGTTGVRRYNRRRTTRQRDGPPDSQQQTEQRQPQTTQDGGGASTQLWKRWEIIASDPAEPETFV